MLGGEISVTSEINRGSKFSVVLPTTTPTSRDTVDLTTRREVARPPVLLLSANANLVAGVSHILATLSTPTLTTRYAQDALRLLTSITPACIILDDQLPRPELLAALMALEEDHQKAVIPRFIVGVPPTTNHPIVTLPRPLRRATILAHLGPLLPQPPPLGELLLVVSDALRTQLQPLQLVARGWRVHIPGDPETAARMLHNQPMTAVILELEATAPALVDLLRRPNPTRVVLGLGAANHAAAQVCTSLVPVRGLTPTLVHELLALECANTLS